MAAAVHVALCLIGTEHRPVAVVDIWSLELLRNGDIPKCVSDGVPYDALTSLQVLEENESMAAVHRFPPSDILYLVLLQGEVAERGLTPIYLDGYEMD